MRKKITIKTLEFNHVWRTLITVWSCTRSITLLRLMLTIVQPIFPLLILYLIKVLIDSFSNEEFNSISDFAYILIAFAVIKLLMILISNWLSYLSQLQSLILSDHMSKKIIEKSSKVDFQHFDTHKYYDVFERALSQSTIRPELLINSITQFIQSFVSIGAILIILSTLHWSVSIVLIIIALPIVIIRWYYTNEIIALKEEQTPIERKANYYKQILFRSEYAKEVRIFNYHDQVSQTFNSIRALLRNEKSELYRKQNISLFLAQSFEVLAMVIALLFISTKALDKSISIGDIALYYGAFQRGQAGVNGILKALISIYDNKLHLNHLYTFLDLESNYKKTDSGTKLPSPIRQLSLDKVTFSYPGGQSAALKNISLNAHQGQILAIVGKNGAGKSTLVKLLAGLYWPDSGRILINNSSITKSNINQYQQNISVLFQDFSKYYDTIYNNIKYGDVNIKDNECKLLKSASKKSLAEPFIRKLPKNYDTILGKSFRSGEELSQGQWQKLALARSIYKKAEIIIFDEPTSHIDPIVESKIFKELKALAQTKIVILITHKVYNLKMADNIIVLQNGEIVETGNHDTLIKAQQVYFKMFSKQTKPNRF